MKPITIEDLLKQHPELDRNEVEEARRQIDRLRDAGFVRARYRLATPQTGKAVRRDVNTSTTHRHGSGITS